MGYTVVLLLLTFKMFFIIASLIHSCQHGKGSPFFPHPCLQWLLSIFLIIAILTNIKCYLVVVSICISLITNSIKHLDPYSLVLISDLLLIFI